MNFFHHLDTLHIKNFLIFLDIDGTLTNDGNSEMSEEVLNKIHDLKLHNKIYLCSNKKNFERDSVVAKKANIETIKSPIKKPSKKLLQEIKNEKNRKLLVIGDKIWPDYFFAKNLKANFIKVKTITSKTDPLPIKFTTFADKILSLFFPNKI